MDAERQVRAYHALSKHAPNAYAPGPGYLDWATQPAPFRRYAGARLIELWQRPLEETPGYDALFAGPIGTPQPLNRASLSQLLYDSLALSAWKEADGNRWALRVNPSSGNLHPTEAYLLLPPGSLEETGLLAHYAADAHGLEVRAELPAALGEQLAAALPAGGFLLGLASIPWREAWKYGERAYRYCQHDLGHALACVGIAAAIQGWQVRLLRSVAEARDMLRMALAYSWRDIWSTPMKRSASRFLSSSSRTLRAKAMARFESPACMARTMARCCNSMFAPSICITLSR